MVLMYSISLMLAVLQWEGNIEGYLWEKKLTFYLQLKEGVNNCVDPLEYTRDDRNIHNS